MISRDGSKYPHLRYSQAAIDRLLFRFLANVRAEVVEQAKRINNHPSVILFSGNNENKQGLQENWYD